MIALPAFSGPVNDFSCSDVVFFSQSKPIIIGFHSLQKSLHSLESVHSQKLKNVDIYLHFESFVVLETFMHRQITLRL